MNYTFYDFLCLAGSLGLFLYGMRTMSEGIQKAAGAGMRKVISYMTSNRVTGILTGLFITMLIQSSSATSVLVVSFVNAGLLSVLQSIGVIMGANIGTTITAWIITAEMKVRLSHLSLPLLAVAVPFLFVNNDRLRNSAEFVIGFALLFMALQFLRDAVPDLSENPDVLAFIQGFTGKGFASVLLFVLFGTALTIVIQSSSATMALTLVFIGNGWIDFPMAAAMVLGENIGTTFTAQLASLAGNVPARRTAMAHTLFNVFGVFWVLVIFKPFIGLIETLMELLLNKDLALYSGTAAEVAAGGMVGLSMFHTVFNVLNALLLVWFVPYLERVVNYLVPLREEPEEDYQLRYFEMGLLATPELAVLEARKEIAKFGKLTRKMFRYVEILAVRKSDRNKRVIERLGEYERECDRKEVIIAQYLAKCSESKISHNTSHKIKSMWSMINDLERIGDLCYQTSKVLERKLRLNIEFEPESTEGLKELFRLIDEAFNYMVQWLNADEDIKMDMAKLRLLEKKINEKRNDLRDEHLMRLEQGSCSMQSGLIFIDLIASCEKIGDHIENVNEASAGIK